MLISLGVKNTATFPEDFNSPYVWGALSSVARFVSEQEATLRGLAISEAVTKAQEAAVTEVDNFKGFVTNNFVGAKIFQDFLHQLDIQLAHDRNAVP